MCFFFSSRSRHTRCALVTGVQTCALPIYRHSPAIQPFVSTGTPRPRADQLRLMIMRVQAALYVKGYDPGAIDGELTESTKLALQKFQGAHGLPEIGRASCRARVCQYV